MTIQAAPPPDYVIAPSLPEPPVRLVRPALFLDLDGVLAPIAPTPEAVVPDLRRTRLLHTLADRFQGRVAVLSGREINEIDRILAAGPIAAAGIHGLERRAFDGEVQRAEPAAALRDALVELRAFAGTRPGLLVEDKTLAVGLHFRNAPQWAGEATRLAEAISARTGLTLQPGHMVLELKTPGTSKGVALQTFMNEAPFAGAVPIMVGDDLTDEHGFRAASAMGGFGVRVGPFQSTDAAFALKDVSSVHDWLDRIEEAR